MHGLRQGCALGQEGAGLASREGHLVREDPGVPPSAGRQLVRE